MKFSPKGFWKEKLDDRYKMVDSILSINSGSYMLMHIRKSQLLHCDIRFWKDLFEEILITHLLCSRHDFRPRGYSYEKYRLKTHGI